MILQENNEARSPIVTLMPKSIISLREKKGNSKRIIVERMCVYRLELLNEYIYSMSKSGKEKVVVTDSNDLPSFRISLIITFTFLFHILVFTSPKP